MLAGKTGNGPLGKITQKPMAGASMEACWINLQISADL